MRPMLGSFHGFFCHSTSSRCSSGHDCYKGWKCFVMTLSRNTYRESKRERVVISNMEFFSKKSFSEEFLQTLCIRRAYVINELQCLPNTVKTAVTWVAGRRGPGQRWDHPRSLIFLCMK